MLNDSDEDKMFDGYEVKMGLNPLRNDAFEDPDGDYINNYKEMLHNSDPLKWDNWFLLYGVYLLPVWVTLCLSYILILKMINKYFTARKRGFKTYKEHKFASDFGFKAAKHFHAAKQYGFSTVEQWSEAVESGFPIGDEWFDAKVSGFHSIDQKMIAESIGFMNYYEFLNALSSKLRRYKFKLNRLFNILVELDNIQFTEMTLKKLQKHHKSIVDIIKINVQLHQSLILYSSVPISDLSLSKDLRNELSRGDELINKARLIAHDILNHLRRFD